MELPLDKTISRYLLTCLLILLLTIVCYFYIIDLIIITVVLVASWIAYDFIQEKYNDDIDPSGKYVLITGCDSGFGLAGAKDLCKAGFEVIAGCYSASSPGAKELRRNRKIKIVTLDISSEESVKQCVQNVKAWCRDAGLWAVVNNAGVNFSGHVELTSMSTYKRVSDVNLYGTVRVVKATLPLLRQAKGRVVNVTSECAFNAWPQRSAYVITKVGIEAFSACLRREMEKFGVSVITVAPSSFAGATSITDSAANASLKASLVNERKTLSEEDQSDAYPMEEIEKIVQVLEEDMPRSCVSPTPVSRAYVRAVSHVSPCNLYMVHGTPREYLDPDVIIARIRPCLPERVMPYLEKVIARAL